MQNDQPELLLMEKVRAGDYEAYRYLFERYYNVLCNYAGSFLKDDFTSEDVVQEVFVKIWENHKRLVITGSVKSYLYTAVRNRSLNRLESESVRKKYTSRLSKEEDNLVFFDELEQEEFRDHLFYCIEKLPFRCKEIFTQSRFENMRQEKIAMNLNISLKTVKAQIGKALKLVRDCLQFSYPEYF